ncbi:hypothetical protein [Nitrosococcus watsonii]|uniref:hypothetical protein n=1 Tax=Nitrosococcus watsonii TaxID=473531 RepID=UPI0018DF787C|nr:hypothetical protein [Nitrosococcus watsonii]
MIGQQSTLPLKQGYGKEEGPAGNESAEIVRHERSIIELRRIMEGGGMNDGVVAAKKISKRRDALMLSRPTEITWS